MPDYVTEEDQQNYNRRAFLAGLAFAVLVSGLMFVFALVLMLVVPRLFVAALVFAVFVTIVMILWLVGGFVLGYMKKMEELNATSKR